MINKIILDKFDGRYNVIFPDKIATGYITIPSYYDAIPIHCWGAYVGSKQLWGQASTHEKAKEDLKNAVKEYLRKYIED